MMLTVEIPEELVTRLEKYARRRNMSLEEACVSIMANYLRTLYERYKTTLAPYTKERLDQLLQWVASEFGVDPSIAFGRKRQRKSVELRQLFTFIAVEALRARKYEIALYLVESFTNVITMYKKTAQLARDKHPFGLYAKLLRDRALARFS